jgi:hypothetical protein
VTHPQAPSRLEALSAYALSAVTTLLWVGCVLPSGTPAAAGGGDDAATPLHRESLLLVPALLLMVLVPVGCALSRRIRGMRAVLASTDAFVVMYAAVALWATSARDEGDTSYVALDAPSLVAIGLLVLLGALSAVEVWRCTRPHDREVPLTWLSGLRLAICLLVLIVPLQILMKPDLERASLLAPFLFVAISAGGARLARDMRGLRRTAALLQVLLAAHVLVTLRFTIHRADPTLSQTNVAGRVTLGLAVAALALATVQLLLVLRRRRAPAGDPAGAPGDDRRAAPV